MRNFFLFGFICVSVVLGYFAYGYRKESVESSDYNSPNPLLIGLNETEVRKEHYLKGQLAFIKFNARDEESLDIFDYHLKLAESLWGLKNSVNERKPATIKKLLQYDLNNDRIISREELEKGIGKSCFGIMLRHDGQKAPPVECDPSDEKRMKEDRIKKILVHDINRDDKIQGEEISLMIEEIYSKNPSEKDKNFIVGNQNVIKNYLALDPNNDGILTIKELENLAIQTFNKYDINKDSTITREESKLTDLFALTFNYNIYIRHFRHYCGYLPNKVQKCLEAYKAYDQLTPKNSEIRK